MHHLVNILFGKGDYYLHLSPSALLRDMEIEWDRMYCILYCKTVRSERLSNQRRCSYLYKKENVSGG
jgi:hypothetical protein